MAVAAGEGRQCYSNCSKAKNQDKIEVFNFATWHELHDTRGANHYFGWFPGFIEF